MPGSWSDFLKLRSGPAPPPSSEAGAVRVYADSNGALRSIQSDGTDEAIGGGGGSQTVTVATVAVSSAELKNLLSAPKTIVAAPGTNKTLVMLAAFVYYVFNTTAYTTPDASTLWLTNGYLSQVDLQSIYAAAQDSAIYLAGGQPPDPSAPGQAVHANAFVDTPILLQNFGGGDVTDGDGTLEVTVYYATLDTP